MKKILDRLHTEQPEREREKSSVPSLSGAYSGLCHCSRHIILDSAIVHRTMDKFPAHRSAALGTDPVLSKYTARHLNEIKIYRETIKMSWCAEMLKGSLCKRTVFSFWLLYKWSPNLQSDELGRIVVRYNFPTSEKILNRALAICVKNVKGEWANVAMIF